MTSRRILAVCLAALAAGIVFRPLPAAGSQQTQGPIAPKPDKPVQQPPEGTIRVRVALVSAPVVVVDEKGEPVLDLRQNDFHILDDGIDQKIEAFDLGGEQLSVVLVFETSSRIAPLLPGVQKSAIVFTQTIVGASGEAAVLSYDDSVNTLLPFSTDNDKIEKTIATLKPGNSGARLYDALASAVGLLRGRPAGQRRAIVVVGEASDSGSEEKLGRVLREAQLSNIVIYSVGLSPTSAGLHAPPSQAGPASATPPGTFGGPSFPGSPQTPTSQQQYGGNIDLLGLSEWAVRNVKAVVKDRPLEVAATATGGTYQPAFREGKFDNAIDAIGGELNSQYMLSYHPTGADNAGYHQIKVTVDRQGVKVRTRPGYYLEAK
ncbi:MAG TPA: VWA domain-containing protein [Candidatus Acidoferrales bacterium]|jgi:VWFA-related protein|nr:VWA domain-containing protein [Candidatus Acidoferrales bacterium]